jgi:hypothetical protein
MNSQSEPDPLARTLPQFGHISAWCLGVSGAVAALALPWHPNILQGSMDETIRGFPAWTVLHLAVAVGAMLSLVGAAGVVLAHQGRLGRLGWLALLLTLLGATATSALFMVEAIAFPILAEHAPELLSLDGPLVESWLLIAVAAVSPGWPLGLSLIGAAAVRVGVFPPRGGVLLVISGLAFVGLYLPFVPVVGPFAAVAFGAVQIYWAHLLGRGHRIA